MSQHEDESVVLILDQTFSSYHLRSFYVQLPLELQNEKYRKILAYHYTRKTGYSYFQSFCDQELKNDRKFIKECLSQNANGIIGMPDEFKADFEFGLVAVQRRAVLYKYLSNELKKDRIIALATLKSITDRASVLENDIFKMNEEFCKDEEIVLEAVKLNPMNFRFAHQDLMGNFDFLRRCVNVNASCIAFMDESLRSNEELASIAVLKDPRNFIYTPLRGNYNFVLNCCKKSPYPNFLKYLQVYNNDEVIVSEIVRKNGLELEHAHDDIKSFNENIVLMALNQDGRALQFVKSPLFGDEFINLTAIRNNPLAFRFANEQFISNFEIVKSSVESNSNCLQLASFQHAQKQFKPQISNQNVKEESYVPVSNELARDSVFEKIRNKVNFRLLTYEEKQLVRGDEELLMEAIKNDIDSAIPYILSMEQEFIRKAIRTNKKCLIYAEHYISNRNFILDACSNYSIEDFSIPINI